MAGGFGAAQAGDSVMQGAQAARVTFRQDMPLHAVTCRVLVAEGMVQLLYLSDPARPLMQMFAGPQVAGQLRAIADVLDAQHVVLTTDVRTDEVI